MPYLGRLTDRAFRDLEAIYEFIEADSSEAAFAWFNRLAEAINDLERLPARTPRTPEDKKFRHSLFGDSPNTYRIICALNKTPLTSSTFDAAPGPRSRTSQKKICSSQRGPRRAGMFFF